MGGREDALQMLLGTTSHLFDLLLLTSFESI
jgi:hypothetical protein